MAKKGQDIAEQKNQGDHLSEQKGKVLMRSIQSAPFTQLSSPRRSIFSSLIFSVTASGMALTTSYFIGPYFKEEFTYLLVFIAFIVSLWFGGLLGGIATLFITTIIGFYFIIPPLQTFSSTEKNLHMGLYIMYGILILWLYALGVYERKRIRVSEKNKAEIIKHLPYGILVLNENLKILDINKEVQKTLGYSQGSLTKKNLYDIIRYQGQLSLDKEIEAVGVGSNKKEIPILVKMIKPSFLGENGVTICTIRDISVQKRIEAEQSKALASEHAARLQAEEEVRAREEFLSIASHELKNPLTSMLLQIQGILHNVRNVSLAEFSIDKMMRMLESSEQQSRRLNKMISDLLNVSLITTGRLELELEKANLTDIVKDVALRFNEQLERAECHFTLHAEKPIPVVVDKVRIEQVFTNLLSNAIKYGKGKPIEMIVEKVDSMARVTVIDYGIGIPPENLERIFNRFERAVDKREYKGLGVGLYIASQIIRAHKGVVKVRSDVGKGSTFIIELPVSR